MPIVLTPVQSGNQISHVEPLLLKDTFAAWCARLATPRRISGSCYMRFVIYLVALVTYLVIDLLWIGFFAASFYKKHLGYLLRPDINLPVGLLFYLLYIFGLMVFVLVPAQEARHTLGQTALTGFLFGLVAYSAYDLTNQATIRDWPILVTIVDMLWGATLSAITSAVAYSVGSFITVGRH